MRLFQHQQQQRFRTSSRSSSTMASSLLFTLIIALITMMFAPIVTVDAIAPSQYMSAVPEALIPWRPLDERFFFPNECFDATNRSCCPEYNGLQCGGDSVGICTNITASDDVCDMSNGWRGLWWFTTWFDSACVCVGNRTGAACERCAPGYSGDDCDVVVEALDRSDFSMLSAVDKQYVIDAFRLSKIVPHPYHTNVSVFDWVAALHRWSLPGITVIDTALHPWAALDDYSTSYSGGHAGSGAITWHRSLTVAMEYALQVATGNTSFAMPYWNWTSSLFGDQDPTLKWFGGDGDSLSREDEGQYCRSRSPVHSTVQLCNCYMSRGAFADWPLVGDWGIALNDTIMRAFGCQTLWGPSIPEAEVERFVVTVPYYDDWATTVEVTAEAAQATAESDAATAEAAIAAKIAAEEQLEAAMLSLMSDQEAEALSEQTSEIDTEADEDFDYGIYDPILPSPATADAPPAIAAEASAIPALAAPPPNAAPSAPSSVASSSDDNSTTTTSSSSSDATASSTGTTVTTAVHLRIKKASTQARAVKRALRMDRIDATQVLIAQLVTARDAAHETAVAAVHRAVRAHHHAVAKGAQGILNELQPLRTGGTDSSGDTTDATDNGWGAVHLTSGSSSSATKKKSVAHVHARTQLYAEARAHHKASVHMHMKTPASDFTNSMYQDDITHASTFHDILGGGYPGEYASWPSAEKPTELHERIHRWLGGTILGEHPGSDPLFWMLHGYADVILERWLRNAIATGTFGVDNSWGASGEALSHGRSECQAPFFPLRTHISVWTNSKQLGFTYDFFDGMTEGTAEAFTENLMPAVTNVTGVATVSDADIPTNELFFVPSSCDSSNSSACCPYSVGLVCGGDTRGSCVNITSSSSACDITTNPLNLWWLSSFTSVCECVSGYTGAACDSCALGYTGYPDCITDASWVVPQRSDFNTLDDVKQQQVIDAFTILKVMPSLYQPSVSAFDFHAATYRWGMSGVPTPDPVSFPELVGVTLAYGDGEHGALTWRRQLLLRLEADMRLALGDPTFALPYWKWTSTSGNNNDAAIRWMGGDGDTAISDPYRCRIPTEDGRGGCNCSLSLGVFTAWTEVLDWATPGSLLRRGFACFQAVAPSLPTIDEVDYAVSITEFDSASDDVSNSSASCFARTLTGLVYADGVASWPSGDNKDAQSRAGLSRRVQNWIGGTATGWSPNPSSDPLFWMHLSYTDLIFERWLRTDNRTDADNGYSAASYLPATGLAMGHNRDECMGPFLPLIRNSDMMLRSTLLGYDYDYFLS